MVEQRRTDSGGALNNPLRERDVLAARRRVPARMVMHEDECASGLPDHAAKDVPDTDMETVDAAGCDAPSCPQSLAAVQGEHPQLLMVERSQPGTSPGYHRILVGQF